MRSLRLLLTVGLSVALAFAAADRSTAQEEKAATKKVAVKKAAAKKAAAKKRPRGPFAPIEDVAGLPRVLLIGDSISIGYTLPTRAALAGKANVHRAPTNCGPTIRGLESIDEWLGKGHWDVIHFNWGLHDLKFIEGKRQVPLDQYEKNMKRLVARLKKTNAKLIWCSTTPVPKGCTPPRTNDDVLAYNAAAKKIMDRNKIAVDDLYKFALPKLNKIQQPANVHFTPEGSKVLAGQVAKSILEALKKPAAKRPDVLSTEKQF